MRWEGQDLIFTSLATPVPCSCSTKQKRVVILCVAVCWANVICPISYDDTRRQLFMGGRAQISRGRRRTRKKVKCGARGAGHTGQISLELIILTISNIKAASQPRTHCCVRSG